MESFSTLFDLYTQGLADEQQEQDFFGQVELPEHQSELEWLVDQLIASGPGQSMPAASIQETLEAILNAPKEEAPVIELPAKKRFGWKRLAVAASILIAISTAAYFIVQQQATKQQPAIAMAKDIAAPVISRAMITLSNGQKIFLDSAANGTLATQGKTNIIKSGNGEIVYRDSGSSPLGEAGMRYNTLSNPRGSQVVNLTLSDGTKVWLNAESSLTYPTAFAGKERKVTITGEAYFEVAHDASKPFFVKLPPIGGTEGGTVQVFGTHFNVNAYEDENEIKVTLLEGSVQVSNLEKSLMIKPGQQAVIKGSSSPAIGGGQGEVIDLEQVMAWKNGLFQFNRTSIEQIMQQVARWYDVEISYEDNSLKEKDFTGGVARKANVSEVLKMLEMTGTIHFSIEGKKIIVKQ